MASASCCSARCCLRCGCCRSLGRISLVIICMDNTFASISTLPPLSFPSLFCVCADESVLCVAEKQQSIRDFSNDASVEEASISVTGESMIKYSRKVAQTTKQRAISSKTLSLVKIKCPYHLMGIAKQVKEVVLGMRLLYNPPVSLVKFLKFLK